MKKRTVITNVPVKLPINSTILYAFLLYHFEVDQIFVGIFISIYVIYWIVAIIVKVNENRIDLEKDEPKKELIKSKFAKRLEELQKNKQT